MQNNHQNRKRSCLYLCLLPQRLWKRWSNTNIPTPTIESSILEWPLDKVQESIDECVLLRRVPTVIQIMLFSFVDQPSFIAMIQTCRYMYRLSSYPGMSLQIMTIPRALFIYPTPEIPPSSPFSRSMLQHRPRVLKLVRPPFTGDECENDKRAFHDIHSANRAEIVSSGILADVSVLEVEGVTFSTNWYVDFIHIAFPKLISLTLWIAMENLELLCRELSKLENFTCLDVVYGDPSRSIQNFGRYNTHVIICVN